MFSIRTDLAIEAREMVKEGSGTEVPGVEVDTDKSQDITITRVKITTAEAEKVMGKPKGQYVTLESPKLKEKDAEFEEEVSKNLAEEIKRITNLAKDATVLVVGLGNWNVTPDALGPKVVSHLLVTRHLIKLKQIDKEGIRAVCALAPGVLGITGIETGEIIRGVVEKTGPDLVIAIDALASRRMDRVAATIQVADTGIHPGSGVGSKRMGITRETLGVQVLAIGVPTVVDAATMANDTIDMMIDTLIRQTGEDSEFYKFLKNMDKEGKYHLIQEIISPFIGNLMVTPKEIDTLVENTARVIAGGLNAALHPKVAYDEITRYLQ